MCKILGFTSCTTEEEVWFNIAIPVVIVGGMVALAFIAEGARVVWQKARARWQAGK